MQVSLRIIVSSARHSTSNCHQTRGDGRPAPARTLPLGAVLEATAGNSRIVEEEDIHLGHSFTGTADARLASSRYNAVRADHPTSCRSPDGAVRLRLRTVDTTPPPDKRTRRRTTKALEALQQLPATRAVATVPQRSQRQQNGDAERTQQHTQQRTTHDGVPPFPIGRASLSSERGRELEGSDTGLGQLAVLIASLKETIEQQSSIISRTRSQSSKRRSVLCAHGSTPPRSSRRRRSHGCRLPPAGRKQGPGITLSRTTSTGTADKDNLRQLVIDVSRVGESTAEKVATTEMAKQAIQ